MYFCPSCSYSFDIVKSSQSSGNKDNRINIEKLAEALKKFDCFDCLLCHWMEHKFSMKICYLKSG